MSRGSDPCSPAKLIAVAAVLMGVEAAGGRDGILGRDPAVASFFAGYITISATYRISSLFAMA